VASKDEGSREVTLDLWAEVDRDGDTVKAIKNSRAVVRLDSALA
jgi:hypothetical protein